MGGEVTVAASAAGTDDGLIKASAYLAALRNEFHSSAAGVRHYRTNAANQIVFASGINVTANAEGASAGTVDAKALASLEGNSIAVHGPAVLSALANGFEVTNVRGRAELFVEYSFSLETGPGPSSSQFHAAGAE